ncbi:hypothetical protein SUGI_0414280 [Cryptomeria japonica]|nr:hypothetical protein SUGI_0414280 [Cryptomeria japonica]
MAPRGGGRVVTGGTPVTGHVGHCQRRSTVLLLGSLHVYVCNQVLMRPQVPLICVQKRSLTNEQPLEQRLSFCGFTVADVTRRSADVFVVTAGDLGRDFLAGLDMGPRV